MIVQATSDPPGPFRSLLPGADPMGWANIPEGTEVGWVSGPAGDDSGGINQYAGILASGPPRAL